MTIAPETQQSTAVAASSVMKQRTADVQAHGSQSPPAAETLHTTDEHPFLTTDRGFVSAEDLRVGEQIRQLDGGYGVVVALRHIFGVAVRYNLTVQDDHTYAVGADQWVAHNTDGCGNSPDDPANADTILQKMHEGVENPNVENKIYATTDEADKAARAYVEEGGEVNPFRNNTGDYSIDENGIRRQYRYDVEDLSHGDAPHINLENQLPTSGGRYQTIFNLHIYLTDWNDF